MMARERRRRWKARWCFTWNITLEALIEGGLKIRYIWNISRTSNWMNAPGLIGFSCVTDFQDKLWLGVGAFIGLAIQCTAKKQFVGKPKNGNLYLCGPASQQVRLVTFAKWKTDTVLRPTPQMATTIMRTRKVEERRFRSLIPTLIFVWAMWFLFQLSKTSFVKVVKALKVVISCDLDPDVHISLSSCCPCSTGSLCWAGGTALHRPGS